MDSSENINCSDLIAEQSNNSFGFRYIKNLLVNNI